MLIGAVIVFSVLTFAAAFAPSVLWFGVLRFLAGLGLGGCLPTGISMVTEFARKGRGSNATTVMMTGYHVGAVLTAASTPSRARSTAAVEVLTSTWMSG